MQSVPPPRNLAPLPAHLAGVLPRDPHREWLSAFSISNPIAELEAKIEELRHVTSDAKVNIQEEIARLQAKSRQLTTSIFANLSPWQITQLARHPQRPYTLDYLGSIFQDFQEMHGDRMFGDDLAIVGGIARLERPARDGDRSPEGAGHEGEGAPQLRDAQAGRGTARPCGSCASRSGSGCR